MSGPDSSETVWTGKTFGVVVEEWGDARREIVRRADGVAVAALDAEGRLVLVRQRREATRRVLLELPAGTVDEGEAPRVAAERELREETGLHGGQWTTGPAVWATPGFCTERIHLFAVTGAEEGETDRDAGERIEIVRLPFEDVLASATSGGIDDAKTLAGVLWLAAMRAA